MENLITAQDLKTRGCSILKKIVKDDEPAIISVHGKDEFVVFTMNDYNKIREMELDLALVNIKKDIEDGNYSTSIEEHKKMLEGALKKEE